MSTMNINWLDVISQDILNYILTLCDDGCIQMMMFVSTAIKENFSCYYPNTVFNPCDYAVAHGYLDVIKYFLPPMLLQPMANYSHSNIYFLYHVHLILIFASWEFIADRWKYCSGYTKMDICYLNQLLRSRPELAIWI
jgi:hypothetical protein